MPRLVVLLAALLLAAMRCAASSATSLGYSDETTIVGTGPVACASGVLIHDDDGSFESGYAWQYGGTVPPYNGALGEAYDLGAGAVVCGAFWLSCLDWDPPRPSDCYVWEGGVGGSPGTVLGVMMDVHFHNVPYWPALGQNDVEMNIVVTSAFTIGYWGDWPGSGCDYFCGADLNGPGGHPWTCIAPGIGYPSGWLDPSIIWGPTSAMGCGVYFEQATRAHCETWSALKALFWK